MREEIRKMIKEGWEPVEVSKREWNFGKLEIILVKDDNKVEFKFKTNLNVLEFFREVAREA